MNRTKRRVGFPMVRRSPFKTSDFVVAFSGDRVSLEHAPWCKSWIDGKTNCDSFRLAVGGLYHGRFMQFASQFVVEYPYFGVLCLLCQTAIDSSDECWVVFKRRTVNTDKATMVDLIEAMPGSFVFLAERDLQKLVGDSSNDEIEAFFNIFHGLRDSAPFWGGDYFVRPLDCFPLQALRSRDMYEERWVGSRVIHVRGNCDYFVLGTDGCIGYVPIEGNRRIIEMSRSFLEYLCIWNMEDRRLYHDDFTDL